MGLAYVDALVRAPGRRGRGRRIRLLVDSGAVYSVLRHEDWKALRLSPDRTLDFVLADGTTLTRGVSECSFELDGHRATSPVVLGETEDEALLGAVTLETLGLVLNPLTRRLQPMRMVLARWTAAPKHSRAIAEEVLNDPRGAGRQRRLVRPHATTHAVRSSPSVFPKTRRSEASAAVCTLEARRAKHLVASLRLPAMPGSP